MPSILDVLYLEFCRARLAEMRKRLLLWPAIDEVPEANRDADHLDGAADRGRGLWPSQEEARHVE